MAPLLHVVLLIKRCYCAQFGAFNPLRKHPCTYPPHYTTKILARVAAAFAWNRGLTSRVPLMTRGNKPKRLGTR
jgi:hypothetical protein